MIAEGDSSAPPHITTHTYTHIYIHTHTQAGGLDEQYALGTGVCCNVCICAICCYKEKMLRKSLNVLLICVFCLFVCVCVCVCLCEHVRLPLCYLLLQGQDVIALSHRRTFKCLSGGAPVRGPVK
jgi:hypothetical protein